MSEKKSLAKIPQQPSGRKIPIQTQRLQLRRCHEDFRTDDP